MLKLFSPFGCPIHHFFAKGFQTNHQSRSSNKDQAIFFNTTKPKTFRPGSQCHPRRHQVQRRQRPPPLCDVRAKLALLSRWTKGSGTVANHREERRWAVWGTNKRLSCRLNWIDVVLYCKKQGLNLGTTLLDYINAAVPTFESQNQPGNLSHELQSLRLTFVPVGATRRGGPYTRDD